MSVELVRKQNLKYGKLSAKETEAIPWDILLVDLIGSYIIRREGHDDLLTKTALTIIDLETGWFAIVRYDDEYAATIENLVEKTWLCRYPRPTIITYNGRNELLGHAFKNDIIEREYGIKSKCATT